MKLVVLITLAAVAMGRPPPCEDYCRTMWVTAQLPPPWDPMCDCMKDQISVDTYNGKPVFTATTIFRLDDSDMRKVDGVTHKDQPFYVTNSIDEFLTKPPITLNEAAANGISVRPPPQEEFESNMNMGKHRSEGFAGARDSNVYKSYSYTYHKEEMPKTKNVNQDSNKTGKSLSKCVDLYNMAVSRIYNNGSKLAKIWGKSKYHKYNKLSDEDLMVTMRQECQGISDFVNMGVEEVIEKQPKKKVASKKASSQTKQNKAFLEPNSAAKAGNVASGPSKDGGVENFKTSGSLRSEENNPIPVPPTTSDASTLSSDVTEVTTPTQDATKLDTEMARPIPEPLETLAPSIINMDIASMNDDKRDEGKYLFDNLTVDGNIRETNSPQWISVYDLKSILEGADANVKATDKAMEIYPNTTITSQNNKGVEAAAPKYPENRLIYKKNEVPLARVITREFAQDLVESVINGTEDLQRDDSTEDDDGETDNPVDAPLKLGNTIQLEMDDVQIPLLTGNLYFRFGEDYIPAKFMKKPDGKLHVAVDGATICGKINLEGDTEPLVLTDLCERFPNNENN